MRLRDVVFVVHPKPPRDEFQYALRCLDFIPHGRVFVLGGNPSWLVNATHVRIKPQDKWQALSDVWHDIAAIEDLSEEFIYTEDDYFITEPVDDIPNFTHPENLAARIGSGGDSKGRGGWGQSMKHTHDILTEHGIDDPYSFDVHIPMVVEKDRIPLEWDDRRGPLRWRSLVGNTATREPVPIRRDVKVHQTRDFEDVKDLGFLSSANKTFRKSGVEEHMRSLFPEPCRYEKEYYMDSSPESPESPEIADENDGSDDRCGQCGKYASVRERIVPSKKPPYEILACGHRRANG